jgi:hypothetical protein
MLGGIYKNLILHEVAKHTIHDIQIYLEHELGQMQQQRSLSTDWLSKHQVGALAEQVVPLFVFAATACRYIGDKRDNPKKRLDIILEYRKVKASKLDVSPYPESGIQRRRSGR